MRSFFFIFMISNQELNTIVLWVPNRMLPKCCIKYNMCYNIHFLFKSLVLEKKNLTDPNLLNGSVVRINYLAKFVSKIVN